jgi:proteasome assembly chaperone (PAC2) family protein
MSDPLTWSEPPGPLRDPILVAAFRGWNDAAAAASSAVAFLAGQLGARQIAAIDPEEFYDFQVTRPQIDLSASDHRITWPEVEVMAAAAPGAERDLVLVSGGEPSLRWRTFSEVLLDTARDLGVGMVVTLGSLLAEVPHTRPVRLTGMATDPTLIEGLGLREPSYVGPTGIVGVVHEAAADRGHTAVSLWAPASHYSAGVANPKASLALLRGVAAVTGLNINLAELQAAAAAYELQVSRAVESDPRLRELVTQLEEAADSGPQMPLPSGDDLARELEQYLREHEERPD